MSQTKKDDSAKETKCKDIQDTLQKENSILEEMLNEAENMHVVFLDRDFNFVRVNEAYAKTCGYKPEEMVGKNHFALYPDEEVEAAFKRVRDMGVPTKFHDRPFAFPDQPERGVTYWDWTLKPVKNKAGEVEGLVFALVETTERKKNEAKLEKSESLYKTLFEKTNDAFQLVEPIYDDEGNAVNYRIIEVNDSYESQVGIKASDVEGKLVTEIDPNIEKNWIETHAAVAKTGNSKRTVIYNAFSKRWYDLFLFPYGEGLVGVLFRDITERKKAEEAVRENAQLYTTLFENTEDGFQVVEPIFDKEGNVCDFRYLAANAAFERQVGVIRSEILGKTAKQVFPTIENHWIEMYSKVLRERKTLHYEDYFDSVKRWYHLFYFMFPNGNIGVLFRDITKRKKTEETLKALKDGLEDKVKVRTEELASERKRFYDMLDNLPVMVCMLTTEHKVAFSNRAFREKFGEPKGRHCYEFVACENQPCESCESFLPLETGEPHHWIAKFPDGTVCEAFDFPFTDVDGSSMILEADIDITERCNLEKKLRDAERLAAIGATAGMVGHDIRNPLQSIVGNLYLIACDAAEMAEGEEKESITESVASIKRNVEYIDKIVQDLQDYAKPLNPVAAVTSLEELVEGLLLDAGFPENVEAKYLLEEEAKEVVADPVLLKRIMQNLVNNAVQAMPEGGRLEIQGRRMNGEVVVSVEDSGVGIPLEHRDKLFTPLFTTKARGQGFGLPVVKRLTEALGGTVTFESEEGKGTKFTVRLPAIKK